MTAETAALIPILLLGVVMAFAFAGCGTLLSLDEDPEPASQPPAQEQPKPKPPIGPVTLPQPPDAYPKLIMEEAGKSLRGYWRFNDPAPLLPGITKALDFDRTTQPQDGVYQGGVTNSAEGVLRQGSDSADIAATFNGTDALVEFPYTGILNPAADFTLEAWIRPEPLTPGASAVILGSYTVTSRRGFVLEVVQVDPTHMNAQVRLGEAAATFRTVTAPLGDGTAIGGWRYVVATYATTPSPVLTLYVLAGAGSATDKAPHPGEQNPNYKAVKVSEMPPFRIGAGWNEPSQTNPGLFFKGRIDEVAIYDKAMEADNADPSVHFTVLHHYKVATTA